MKIPIFDSMLRVSHIDLDFDILRSPFALSPVLPLMETQITLLHITSENPTYLLLRKVPVIQTSLNALAEFSSEIAYNKSDFSNCSAPKDPSAIAQALAHLRYVFRIPQVITYIPAAVAAKGTFS